EAYGEVIPISSVTKSGLDELLNLIIQKLADIPKEHLDVQRVKITPNFEEDSYTIEETEDGFSVQGKALKWIERFDHRNFEALQYIETRLEHLGVMDDLRNKGAKDGDIIHLGEFEFEFIE
ncbi:MAG TPA: Obg family GTPase CgtA, partial [Firmicutes bacterium]|nr:Obg family GTPase CgtA [Bacillota bacterium]